MPTYIKELDTLSPSYPYGPVCNGCNGDIRAMPDHKAWAVYTGKRELKANQPYDVYCSNDIKSWKGAIVVTAETEAQFYPKR